MLNSTAYYSNQMSKGVPVGEEPIIAKDKEAIILRHCDLIKYTALRLASRLPPHISAEDLFNAGVIGLMDAIDKFDPDQQIQFKTYAKIRIKGAMLDEIRSMDWIPRSLRQKSSMLEKTCAALEEDLGRYPTDEEIADKLEISLESYYKLLDEVKGISLLPMEINEAHQCEHGEDSLTERSGGPFQVVYQEQIREHLAEAISHLPKKEQLVLSLYYYEELTMKEIGAVLGYTESRISQLHTKAVLHLRTRLAHVLKREDLPDQA